MRTYSRQAWRRRIGSVALAGLAILATSDADATAAAMFDPQLTLTREVDGQFTLGAVTLAPNVCYAAGPAKRGLPENTNLDPDSLGVLLTVKSKRGPCMQQLKPLRHSLANLKLAKKRRVVAFVVKDGAVLGSSTIRVPTSDAPLADIDTSDWYGWINRMPPGPTSLHVTGTVIAPTPGFTVSLVPASPPGSDPTQLVLDLELVPQQGLWPDVLTPMVARYDDPDYGGAHTTVLIRHSDGEHVMLTLESVF